MAQKTQKGSSFFSLFLIFVFFSFVYLFCSFLLHCCGMFVHFCSFRFIFWSFLVVLCTGLVSDTTRPRGLCMRGASSGHAKRKRKRADKRVGTHWESYLQNARNKVVPDGKVQLSEATHAPLLPFGEGGASPGAPWQTPNPLNPKHQNP